MQSLRKILYALFCGLMGAMLTPSALADLLSKPTQGQAQELPPPREVRLVEKKFEELSNRDIDPMGKQALAIAPEKWKHAETDNFIIHYRRVTEAQRAVREIEFDLWFVAKTLGASKEQYAKKSHVYIFQDEKEWIKFLSETDCPDWFASFAHGDTLFLHVGGAGEGFDSHLLAHETTHAVVARLYPASQWPHWLGEGFAEYMGSASVAARKRQTLSSLQNRLHVATLSFEELTSLTSYPTEREKVSQLYQSSEKVIRFLMTEFPKDRIARFIEAILAGKTFEAAVIEVYGDKVKDFDAFRKLYERFK